MHYMIFLVQITQTTYSTILLHLPFVPGIYQGVESATIPF